MFTGQTGQAPAKAPAERTGVGTQDRVPSTRPVPTGDFQLRGVLDRPGC